MATSRSSPRSAHLRSVFKVALVALAALPCESFRLGAGGGAASLASRAGDGRRRVAPPRAPSIRFAATAALPDNDAGAGAAPSVDGDRRAAGSVVPTLDSIRSAIIRQEETIIFALIERAQFRQNERVYRVGGVEDLGVPPGSTPADGELSFMEFMLVGTETHHSSVGRYNCPEEHAFFPHRLPSEGMMGVSLPGENCNVFLSSVGGANSVNFNDILHKKYVQNIIPAIAQAGDDEQYGSCVIADVAALQVLSRKIHYGKVLAETKYLTDPDGYQTLVDAGDYEGVMHKLTDEDVEERALRRARLKAATYGREPMMPSVTWGGGGEDNDSDAFLASAVASAVFAAAEAVGNVDDTPGAGKVDPGVIEGIYRDLIIPMANQIEAAYLFLRCGRDPPPEFFPDGMIIDKTKECPA